MKPRPDGRSTAFVILSLSVLLLASVSRSSGAPQSGATMLIASDAAAGDRFGLAIAISGNTAIVGAQIHDGRAGAAYVFERMGGAWVEVAELTASDAGVGNE